jgi:hypothetical protein
MIRRSRNGGTNYVECFLMTREHGETRPVGCGNWYDSDRPAHLKALQLDGLGMWGFVSDYDECPFIGYDIHYRGVYCIDREAANNMVRTLNKVAREHEKEPAAEPGDRLMVLARAFKLDFVVEPNEESRSGFRFMSVTDGRDRYRQLIAEARRDTCQGKNGTTPELKLIANA